MEKKMVAVCGKGGSGKTALVALMTKHLLEDNNRRLLIIDADPAMNLSPVLGVTPQKTVNDVREHVIKEARKAGKTEKKNLARSLDYMLFEALIEQDRFSLLVMGRPESLGCYCSVNDLLRDGIETLAENYDVILIDGEAGIEQINRQVMQSVDTLAVVSDMSNRGLQTASTIGDVITAHKKIFKYQKLGLILNRVHGREEQLLPYASRTGLDLFGLVPEDSCVSQFDLEGRPLLELPAESAAYQAIKGVWQRVLAPGPPIRPK